MHVHNITVFSYSCFYNSHWDDNSIIFKSLHFETYFKSLFFQFVVFAPKTQLTCTWSAKIQKKFYKQPCTSLCTPGSTEICTKFLWNKITYFTAHFTTVSVCKCFWNVQWVALKRAFNTWPWPCFYYVGTGTYSGGSEFKCLWSVAKRLMLNHVANEHSPTPNQSLYLAEHVNQSKNISADATMLFLHPYMQVWVVLLKFNGICNTCKSNAVSGELLCRPTA